MSQNPVSNIEKASINVLLIGNNPGELSAIYEHLCRYSGVKFIIDIAFSVSDALAIATKLKPNHVLVDDNLKKLEIRKFTKNMSRISSTKDIPITLLKTSNYHSMTNLGFQDFLMKETFSADKFYRSIKNLLKWKRAQAYLDKS